MTVKYPRKKYPRFNPRLKDSEKNALDKLRKPGESDRELLLRIAGIPSVPIRMGRPKGAVSHSLDAADVERPFSDHHVHTVPDVYKEEKEIRERRLRG